MAGERFAWTAASRHDNHHPNPPRPPALLSGESRRRDPDLSIQRREHLLQVDDPRLHLDDQQHLAIGAPPNHVDGPSLTVRVERVLDHRLPALTGQTGHDGIHQRRMVPVQKPIATISLPSAAHVQRDTEHVGDPLERPYLQPAQIAALHSRDGLLGDARTPRELGLRKPLLQPDDPNEGRDPRLLHPPTLARCDHLRLTTPEPPTLPSPNPREPPDSARARPPRPNRQGSLGTAAAGSASWRQIIRIHSRGKEIPALKPRLTLFLGAIAVSALLAGCVNSSGSDGKSPDPTAPPSQGTAVPRSFYLRAWQSQALAPEYTFAWLPGVTISDGKYIDGHVAVPAIFPGPLWVGPSIRSITPTGITTILAEARRLGLLGDKHDFSEGLMPGSISAHVEMIVDGTTYSLYGLPDADGNPDPGTPAAFSAFYSKLGYLDGWIGDQLGESAPYEPERLAVLTLPPSKDTSGITPTQVDWPLTTPFATFGSSGGSDQYRCAVVEGADLAKLLPVIKSSNALTRFKDSAGVVLSLTTRVLVPGETGPCS
jgi:hypothetical protein